MRVVACTQLFPLVARGSFAELQSMDQLKACQRAGLSFVGFQEPQYVFPPTFKVKRGTTAYEHTVRLFLQGGVTCPWLPDPVCDCGMYGRCRVCVTLCSLLGRQMEREPSYCDRVLWKSLPAFRSDVVCHGAAGHPGIITR